MSVLTLILAGGEGNRLSILGEKHAKPAVPFGGKYRIIDVPLSNVVNSELYRIAVLTQYRPHSLMQHLGIGEPWNLNRRWPNGIQIWQPYRGRRDRGTADALYQNGNFIAEDGSDLLLVLSVDHIYKQVLCPGISVLPPFPWGRCGSPSQYPLTQQVEIRSAIHTSLD